MTRSISIALLAALLALPAGPVTAAPLAIPRLPGASETAPGELLVKFKTGASARSQAASVAAVGHGWIGALGDTGWVHARVGPGQTDAQALAAYAGDPRVEFAQPNFIYRASAVPNDPGYQYQWGWKNSSQTITNVATQPDGSPIGYTSNNPGSAGSDMNLEKAWDRITDCSSVVVAVIDSGVNYTHQDLAANMWSGNAQHGRNFSADVVGTDPMDLNGHGTHVAGTIGAFGNNAIGVTGVCWRARIMAVRVLGADGAGNTAGIIQGIDFAVANGAKVINMSLGGGGTPDTAYGDALTRAQAADVVVVVAAGNDGKDNQATPVFPCNFTHPNLICVAALDQAFQLASFSNWGATSVDVGAPGTNIVSTWNGPDADVPLDAGWTFLTNSASVGWGYQVFGTAPDTLNGLTGPANFGSYSYINNTNDRAWITYDMSAVSRAVLKISAAWDLGDGDSFNLAARSATGDPFPAGLVDGVTGGRNPSWDKTDSLTFDISSCVSANCTIGFQLLSDGIADSPLRYGVALTGVSLATVRNPGTDYNTENGTSMATPAVAGLATMLRAYNPAFTQADVVGAIKGGGRAAPALAGKTTTGKAADAMGSLAFITPPTGVSAVVH